MTENTTPTRLFNHRGSVGCVAGALVGPTGDRSVMVVPFMGATTSSLEVARGPTERIVSRSPLRASERGVESGTREQLSMFRDASRATRGVESGTREQLSMFRDASRATRGVGLETFARATRVVWIVVRNSVGCLLSAWITTSCYNLGNVFSLRSSRDQSTEELIVATLAWSNAAMSTMILLTQAALLSSLRFLVRPHAPAGVVFCLKRLVRATLFYYIGTLAAVVAWGCFTVLVLPLSFRRLKLAFYIGIWVNHTYATGAIYRSRLIFKNETREGQQFVRTQSPARIQHGGSWRTYLKTSPQVITITVTSVYVDIASQHLREISGLGLVLFAAANLALKVGVQELAKHYVVKREIRQLRFMCVLLALPTVLIDTQVRTALLLGGNQSTTVAAAGSTVMVSTEIAMRFGKVGLMLYQIRKRQRAAERAHAGVALPQSGKWASVSPISRVETPIECAQTDENAIAAFESWRKLIIDFHTAEVLADMYAEYIAIGCSASILYFFSDHPKYVYASVGGSVELRVQFQIIGFQVAMELAVDYVCCVFELTNGAQFHSVRQLSSFLGFMFMAIAVANIGISSFLYIK